MGANSIDEVILRLDQLVEEAWQESGRYGYFAALCARMTRAVRAGIHSGRFADPAKTAELDVVFANRYLEAFEAWRAGKETVFPKETPSSFHADFLRINEIIAGLTDEIEGRVGRISRWFTLLDWLSGRTDEAIFNFSVKRARDFAWSFVEELVALPAAEHPGRIARVDRHVILLAREILRPGLPLRMGVFVVRMAEQSDVRAVLDVLRGP